LIWTRYLGSSVGLHLRKVYLQLANFLRSHQISGVNYAIGGNLNQSATSVPSRVVVQRSGGNESAESRGRASTSRLTLNQLRQVISGDNFRNSGLQTYDASANDVLGDLEEMSVLVQRLSARNAIHAWQASEEMDSQLHTSRAQAISVREFMEESTDDAGNDVVAQDVVRMMVDNLCDDERLLLCVRDWVGSMEPPLLALVAVDASFLSDELHPAKKLLDEVTQRSLGFLSDTEDGFLAFFNPVLLACAELKPYAMQDAQPFALLQVEQRNLLAEKIALELTRQDDARLAPIVVKQFIAGPWSQVLAKARLSTTQAENSLIYLQVVSDLLWSAVPERAAKNKQRLVRLIPGMLSKLRAGLATVGSPEHEGEVFFAQLMKIHEAAFKTGIAASDPDKSKKPIQQKITASKPQSRSDDFSLEKATQDAVKNELESHAEDAVWMAPEEARNSGFMTDFTEAHNTEKLRVQASEYAIESTPTWVRAQLTWASPHGTLFMFTGAAGKPYSMTRRALDKMLKNQTLRVITQDSLVTSALNAVAQTALHNTINPTENQAALSTQ
jgi:hypothetical protein